MSFWAFKPYVPVAKKRKIAEDRLKTLQKKNESVSPVIVTGNKIAKSFWGASWCSNLESYSDFAYRLPRGRSYVRQGAVIDLQIRKGEITALVSGSEIYGVKVSITPVAVPKWKAICKDCAGSIDSLIELLQGRLSKAVMDRVCKEHDGLFPAPQEIKMSCSCPDWADMCKHVAATLYAVGARLDAAPEHLFTLRGVEASELAANASSAEGLAKVAPGHEKVLADDDISALFGLEMAAGNEAEPAVTKAQPRRKVAKRSAPPAKTRRNVAELASHKAAMAKPVPKGLPKRAAASEAIKPVKRAKAAKQPPSVAKTAK